MITTLAGSGNGSFSGDGGPGSSATLNFPSGVAVGPGGDVYIADSYNQRVRRVSTDGTITTFAGAGGTGANAGGFSGDGALAVSARLNVPSGVAVDSSGSVYIADMLNNRIRRVLPNGVITTVAGSGSTGLGAGGYAGDGGAATSALLNNPLDAAVDAGGNVYVADSGNYVVRLLRPTGQVISPTNPQPTINTISPSTVQAGSAALTLTINGANFLPSSTVTFNGVSHATSFVSAGQVTITLSTSDLATAGTFPVVVTNPGPGGGASNATNFTVAASGSGSLQGKLFTINGTLSISGSKPSFEISAVPNSDASDLITIDDETAILSSPVQLELQYTSTASISGNTATFSGTNVLGYYTADITKGLSSVNSVTLVITFTSATVGSPVTGTLTIVTSGGTVQGTFTGTFTAIG